MEAEECQPTYSLPPPQVHGAHQNRRHGSTKRIRVADCCEGRAARDPAPLGKYQKSSVGEAMAVRYNVRFNIHIHMLIICKN
jgi:hypothetical protein